MASNAPSGPANPPTTRAGSDEFESSPARLTTPGVDCLNCSAPVTGEYCAACGQQVIDLAEPTWHVVRDAVAEATDLDGRLLRTAGALSSPGRLTLEFTRGRRAPYVGPVKVFLLAGTALTTTWVLTRGVDSRYYGLEPLGGAADYIDTVVRGSLAASVAVAVCSWLLGGARRRLLNEAVFALHLVAALSVLATIAIWLGAAWKLVWGTAADVPRGLPTLPFLLFLPVGVVGLAYTTVAVRRVHGGPWWTVVLRATVIVVAGAAVVTGILLASRGR